MKALRSLAAAFSYFSILPVTAFDTKPDAAAIGFLPVVGAVIGALSGLAAAAIFHLEALWWWPATLVALVLCIVLSGAIHVDGFLDCCDGLCATAAPERRLEIMRDPHHGTYALVGMSLLALTWFGGMGFAAPVSVFPLILAFTGASSRAFAAVAAKAPLWPSAIAIVPVLIYYRPYELWKPAVALIAAGCVATAFVIFARRRLHGALNGDCYGAIVVLTEMTLLLALGLTKSFR